MIVVSCSSGRFDVRLSVRNTANRSKQQRGKVAIELARVKVRRATHDERAHLLCFRRGHFERHKPTGAARWLAYPQVHIVARKNAFFDAPRDPMPSCLGQRVPRERMARSRFRCIYKPARAATEKKCLQQYPSERDRTLPVHGSNCGSIAGDWFVSATSNQLQPPFDGPPDAQW